MSIVKEINQEIFKSINHIVKHRKTMVVIHRPLTDTEKKEINSHFYKVGWSRVKISRIDHKNNVWSGIEFFQD